MNSTYRLISVLGLGLALVSPAAAQAPTNQPGTSPAPAAAVPPDQQPTKEQLARLFELMRVREQMNSLMKMLPAIVQQQVQVQAKELASKLHSSSITPVQQAAIDKMMNKYMEKAAGLMPIDEMLSDMTVIYQRHLSRTDVDAFIAFYSSPAGQHLLDEQPAILREYMPLAMKRVEARSKELTDEMADDMQKCINSAAPTGDKPARN